MLAEINMRFTKKLMVGFLLVSRLAQADPLTYSTCKSALGYAIPARFVAVPSSPLPAAPPYANEMTMSKIREYLDSQGYQNPQISADHSYFGAFNLVYIQNDSIGSSVGALGYSFLSEPSLKLGEQLGQGEKGYVVGANDSEGQHYALKMPFGKRHDANSADLMLNLELEFWLNIKMREWFDRYHVAVIPILYVGPHGTYFVTERFNQRQVLGAIINEILIASLAPQTRSKMEEAIVKKDTETIGIIVRDHVLKNLDSALLRKLRITFSGIQNVAKDKDLHFDFVTDNIAILDDEVVLFDTGIRLGGGRRAQRYTLGMDYDGSSESLLSFEGWLEIAHINWLVNQGILNR